MSIQPTSIKIPGKQLRDGRFEKVAPSVVIERELHITLNGAPLATASLMPGMEKEFVTGYLFGQGFIATPQDISSLILDETSATVTLQNNAAPTPAVTAYRIVSGGGITAFADDILPEIQSDIILQKTTVFRAMTSLFQIATVYKETEGAHAAGIFTPEAEPVCIVEDIGRHNCLDKAIGYALLQHIDCSCHFMVSTGRMTSEMVAKLCRAGFPVVATKTAITDKGRETALACGITLVGFVRDTGTKIHTNMDVRIIKDRTMKIYTGPKRIASS